MKKEILKCIRCGRYTLKTKCPLCNEKTLSSKPAKYSVDDKYGKYRRMAKDVEHSKNK